MQTYTYDLLPKDVEISPNNRGKCRSCFKKVKKGLPRIKLDSKYVHRGKTDIVFHGYAYVCDDCIDYVFKTIKEKVTELKKEHRKLSKRQSVKKTKLVLALEPEEEPSRYKLARL